MPPGERRHAPGVKTRVYTVTFKIETPDEIFGMEADRMRFLQVELESAVFNTCCGFEVPLGKLRGTHESDVDSVELVDVRDDAGTKVYVGGMYPAAENSGDAYKLGRYWRGPASGSSL